MSGDLKGREVRLQRCDRLHHMVSPLPPAVPSFVSPDRPGLDQHLDAAPTVVTCPCSLVDMPADRFADGLRHDLVAGERLEPALEERIDAVIQHLIRGRVAGKRIVPVGPGPSGFVKEIQFPDPGVAQLVAEFPGGVRVGNGHGSKKSLGLTAPGRHLPDRLIGAPRRGMTGERPGLFPRGAIMRFREGAPVLDGPGMGCRHVFPRAQEVESQLVQPGIARDVPRIAGAGFGKVRPQGVPHAREARRVVKDRHGVPVTGFERHPVVERGAVSRRQALDPFQGMAQACKFGITRNAVRIAVTLGCDGFAHLPPTALEARTVVEDQRPRESVHGARQSRR